MAKSSIIILASALCFLSFINNAYSEDKTTLQVEGVVFCDSCRIQFITRISELIQGAKVKLECKDRESGSITYSKEAETNEQGRYSIEVDSDHEEEDCEVVLVSSPNEDCNEINHDLHQQTSARISLTKHNGIAGPVRIPNPLGFMKKEAAPECPEVLKELGLTPDGNIE
ncbi:putative pollen allergen Ole e 1 family [Rosa chinensis]|uniref:Putative pollen allergen Ole e 1 family n=1 Tax=Rosa chinensis TaxID=74649 RepID=A0A2P6Q4R0_ROSCH|nr:olee1-like protein [Rosa chinensis]PRQ29149.1 putative pollen allergen Ole e 1 family [Rosa chinensis]